MDSVKLDCRVALLGRIAMRIARDVDYCYRCSVVCLYVCLLGKTVRPTKRLSRLRCCLGGGRSARWEFSPWQPATYCKFILIVTSIICLWCITFFSLSVWVVDSGGPKERCIRWGPVFPQEETLWGSHFGMLRLTCSQYSQPIRNGSAAMRPLKLVITISTIIKPKQSKKRERVDWLAAPTCC